jgi:fructose-1,6-bisphosphatase I/sedoheptulose-1,7-bisphosphatase
VPTSLHQRVGFVFGARDEVERIEELNRAATPQDFGAPLFAARGLIITAS